MTPKKPSWSASRSDNNVFPSVGSTVMLIALFLFYRSGCDPSLTLCTLIHKHLQAAFANGDFSVWAPTFSFFAPLAGGFRDFFPYFFFNLIGIIFFPFAGGLCFPFLTTHKFNTIRHFFVGCPVSCDGSDCLPIFNSDAVRICLEVILSRRRVLICSSTGHLSQQREDDLRHLPRHVTQ